MNSKRNSPGCSNLISRPSFRRAHRRLTIARTTLFSALLAVVLLSAAGCQPGVRKRPIGFLRLGKVQDLLAPETYLPEQRLLVGHDEGGFFVMSTMCTYDLSPLSRTTTPQGVVWMSKYNPSKYDASGKVLEGPAKVDLPFYELVLDSGVYGGPVDTLYAHVGIEKPRNWRLKVETAPSRAQR